MLRQYVANPKAAANRRWYAKNRRRVIDATNAYHRRFPVERVIRNTRAGAQKRDLEYSLDDRHAVDLITDNCFYCGVAPAPVNGIDRVDNVRGYVEDNVVSCCGVCNVAKNNKTVDAFIGWAYRVHTHQEQHRG